MNKKWTKDSAPKGKGRGPSRFSFTYEDIAKATNQELHIIRQHVVRNKFNPKSLLSVVMYVMKHRLQYWLKQEGKSDDQT